MKGTSAIVGLGLTEMGKVYGRSRTDFAAEAIALALEDAGLAASDVDGRMNRQSMVRNEGTIGRSDRTASAAPATA